MNLRFKATSVCNPISANARFSELASDRYGAILSRSPIGATGDFWPLIAAQPSLVSVVFRHQYRHLIGFSQRFVPCCSGKTHD